ncbi:MAG: hypothetical protein ACTHK0_10195, partial [Ginsengibacter sp.]
GHKNILFAIKKNNNYLEKNSILKDSEFKDKIMLFIRLIYLKKNENIFLNLFCEQKKTTYFIFRMLKLNQINPVFLF